MRLANAVWSLRASLHHTNQHFCTRIERVIDDVDILDWLASVDVVPLVFWAPRKGTMIGGAGAADISADAFDRDLPPGACYVGGGRFDPGTPPDDEWADLGSAMYVLPAVTVERSNHTVVACHVVDVDATRQVLDDLLAKASKPLTVAPVFVTTIPDATTWRHRVLRALNDPCIDKVVLARRESWTTTDPLDLLSRLPHDSCYRFAIVTERAAFVGCSPELLFEANATHIECDVLAGTRPRGNDVDDDDALFDQLLQSDKDRRENEVVARSLASTLRQFSRGEEEPRLSDVHVLSLPTVHHLRRSITVATRDGDFATFLRALHPTPATLGSPPDQARSFIRRHADFDYGWFAGPFGAVSDKEAAFCVAIRSALVTPRHTYTYAGAGIVDGSDPDAEADEIYFKLQPIRLAMMRQQQCAQATTRRHSNNK